MNKIPLVSHKPWVITFESGLPRTHNHSKILHDLMRERLLSPKCLGLIAMSQWASRIFQLENQGWERLPEALAKLSVIYPSLPARRSQPRQLKKGETLEIAFVGNSFARKGGIVALRLARKAAEMGLRVRIHIVSAMRYGRGEQTDHPDAKQYAADLRCLDLPNVHVHGQLPNEGVHEVLERAHLLLLASLHDTFGFSVLEGFSRGLPAIASDVCALPEMVTAQNGFLLHLEKDERNCWRGINAPDHDRWPMLDATYESMSRQALEVILELMEDPGKLEELSEGAMQTLSKKFNPEDAVLALERIYGSAKRPTA
jgi:glycosyltransferase involved in cell wall biosynthesis